MEACRLASNSARLPGFGWLWFGALAILLAACGAPDANLDVVPREQPDRPLTLEVDADGRGTLRISPEGSGGWSPYPALQKQVRSIWQTTHGIVATGEEALVVEVGDQRTVPGSAVAGNAELPIELPQLPDGRYRIVVSFSGASSDYDEYVEFEVQSGVFAVD